MAANERQVVPVLPLRGTVVFPRHTTTLTVGRPLSMKAVEAAAKGDKQIFAVAERERDPEEELTPDALYTMGVIAS